MPRVVDRPRLPEDWPTNRGSPAFWEELGRTVVTFSHLEDMAARAYFGLTATRQFEDWDQAEATFPQWEKELKQSLTDSLYSLTSKLRKAFADDDRVCDDLAGNILARLDELRVWRNALSHGAWHSFEADGSTCLRHFKYTPDGPEALEGRLSINTISAIRAATADLIVDIVTAAGVRFPGSALPGANVTELMIDRQD